MPWGPKALADVARQLCEGSSPEALLVAGLGWPHGACPAGSVCGECASCLTGHGYAQSGLLESSVLLTSLPRAGLCVFTGVCLCESECLWGRGQRPGMLCSTCV